MVTAVQRVVVAFEACSCRALTSDASRSRRRSRRHRGDAHGGNSEAHTDDDQDRDGNDEFEGSRQLQADAFLSWSGAGEAVALQRSAVFIDDCVGWDEGLGIIGVGDDPNDLGHPAAVG